MDSFHAVAPYVQSYTTFAAMVLGAFVLGMTPLGRPLQWAETYYHELSHGLAAMLTFGRFHRIELYWNGGGKCMTSGGSRTVILLSGYMGAALWGGLLYYAGHRMGAFGVGFWLKMELAVLAVTTLFWVRNLQTLTVMVFLAFCYGGALLLPDLAALPWLLQFMGIYVMLNAIRAPLALIDGKHVGDGAALADKFLILPELFWVAFWFLFAILVLVWCMEVSLPGFPNFSGMVLELIGVSW